MREAGASPGRGRKMGAGPGPRICPNNTEGLGTDWLILRFK